MKVEQVKVKELVGMAAPYNPRKISPKDMESLRSSLRYFGAVEPVVINRRSGKIVGGHQRVIAADKEGMETLPAFFVDLDDPSEKQLNLALNRVSGDWDQDKLYDLLMDLETQGADLELTGFLDTEIEKLLAQVEDKDGTLAEPQLAGLTFQVIVTCESEEDQRELIERLENEGRTCQTLIS